MGHLRRGRDVTLSGIGCRNITRRIDSSVRTIDALLSKEFKSWITLPHALGSLTILEEARILWDLTVTPYPFRQCNHEGRRLFITQAEHGYLHALP
jgi:hypothetical protein